MSFYNVPYFTDLRSSCTNTATFQLARISPLQWKASLRLCNTSANHRTSLTSCITYSGSAPGAPIRWDVKPMLLRGFLEFRPMSQVLVDPADRDPVWGLEWCLSRAWVRFVPPPPPPLLLLFRSIPAPAGAATLSRGAKAGQLASEITLWSQGGWKTTWKRKMMCVVLLLCAHGL